MTTFLLIIFHAYGLFTTTSDSKQDAALTAQRLMQKGERAALYEINYSSNPYKVKEFKEVYLPRIIFK